jgi:phosphohistidine swiveling domain-containing protein
LNQNPYTAADLIEEVGKSQDDNPLPMTARERQQALARLTTHERTLVTMVSLASWLRDERIAWYGEICTRAYPLLRAGAAAVGFSYEEFIQCTLSEMEHRTWDRAVLHKRMQGYRFEVVDGVMKITTGVQRSKVSTKDRVVKGIPAYPGSVRGVVQCADAYSFSRIRRGVVLVTAMTTPDATPFLRRVKAIVTDEGGATAHAAIIAREFKIPCVVGTKNATKVLHDGDRVEVDADHGVVTVLKRSNE